MGKVLELSANDTDQASFSETEPMPITKVEAVAAELLAMTDDEYINILYDWGAQRLLSVMGECLSEIEIAFLAERLTQKTLEAIMAVFVSEYTDLDPTEALSLPFAELIDISKVCLASAREGKDLVSIH